MVKTQVKIKELYQTQRKGLTQPVSFALMAAALSSCGGGGGGSGSTTQNINYTGAVVKGPLQNALVFLDTNGNNIKDASEVSVLTDAKGNYSFSAPSGAYNLIATTTSNTIDTSSGEILDGVTFKAPKSSSIISPITTVMVETGLSKEKVSESLGIAGVDILTFNPFDDGVDEQKALSMEKVSHQTLLTINAISSAAKDSGIDEDKAFELGMSAFSKKIIEINNTSSSTVIDLSNENTIDDFITVAKTVIKDAGGDENIFQQVSETLGDNVKTNNKKISDLKDMDSTDAKTAFANSAKITKLVEDAIKELDLETVTSTSSSTSTTTAPTTTTTTTSTSTSPSTSKVITGTSGDDYLELTVWDFIASGNGGNDTFIVSAQGEIIDLSTGDIIIPNSAHINAKNVKNFIATSESKLSGSSATNFYSDISGSEIDMSLATFMSDGPQGVTFIVGNGVDLLTGTAEGDQFMVMQSSAANSDSLDGKGGEWDRLTLMGNSHSFLNDSNIKNIERISFNSSIGDNSNLDLSSQTENFIEIGGGAGNDIIKSGSGNDSISTGLGNDMIYSGAGSDTLTGGTGSDTFVYLKSDGTSGADTITDFTAQAGDKIDLSSFGISTKSKALDTMTDDGSGNTQVTIDGDLIVTLNGISKSVLSGYDFIA